VAAWVCVSCGAVKALPDLACVTPGCFSYGGMLAERERPGAAEPRLDGATAMRMLEIEYARPVCAADVIEDARRRYLASRR
jgi:hypothetical protein